MKNMVKCENSYFTLWEQLDPVIRKCHIELDKEERMHIQNNYFSAIRKKGDGVLA
jgi:hypothetical protein